LWQQDGHAEAIKFIVDKEKWSITELKIIKKKNIKKVDGGKSAKPKRAYVCEQQD
jgi:hypothetical protein